MRRSSERRERDLFFPALLALLFFVVLMLFGLHVLLLPLFHAVDAINAAVR